MEREEQPIEADQRSESDQQHESEDDPAAPAEKAAQRQQERATPERKAASDKQQQVERADLRDPVHAFHQALDVAHVQDLTLVVEVAYADSPNDDADLQQIDIVVEVVADLATCREQLVSLDARVLGDVVPVEPVGVERREVDDPPDVERDQEQDDSRDEQACGQNREGSADFHVRRHAVASYGGDIWGVNRRPSREPDRRTLILTKQHDFPSTFDGVRELTARLRGPDGCPWDKEQTADTLKHLFLEECYELVEAIEEGDAAKMVEELGDVLFHAASQIQIAEESGAFTGADVCKGVIDKLVRRHPHVFADVMMDDASEAVPRWDKLKRDEMAGTERSILDGVPKVMPALSYAQAVQGCAARMGFDWDDYEGVLDKVAEELREIRDAPEQEREGEIGDLLFTVVNACRWLGVEAETALRQTNRKVYYRFTAMERLARERGMDFEASSLDEKEELWQEAKPESTEGGRRVSVLKRQEGAPVLLG